jgi:hypothetical protein
MDPAVEPSAQPKTKRRRSVQPSSPDPSSSLSTSPSSRTSPTNGLITTPKSNRRRLPYKCHKCGKPKKGHICTALPGTPLFKDRTGKSNVFSSPPSPGTETHGESSGVDRIGWDRMQGQGEGDEEEELEEGDVTATTTTKEESQRTVPPFMGELTDNFLYHTSSDNIFPTDTLSRYELAETPAWGAGSGGGDMIGGITLDEADMSALGFIDERPLQNVGGVGITLDSKKAPFFVSWFDNVTASLKMLETFLKTQKPSWPLLKDVLEHLEEEKKRVQYWKENFEQDVISKTLEDHLPVSTSSTINTILAPITDEGPNLPVLDLSSKPVHMPPDTNKQE